MTGKITTYKPTVAPLRKYANWNDSIHTMPKPPFPLKGVKEMNREEQADEIVRRLSQPYKTPAEHLEEEMMTIISMNISKEIDNEVLAVIKNRYPNSTTYSNGTESNT